MTLFKVTAVTLLTLFLMSKHSKGQFDSLVMYPDKHDKVLEVGASLNLTCTYNITHPEIEIIQGSRLNISWNLPDHVVQNISVRNIFCLQFDVIKMNIFFASAPLIISFFSHDALGVTSDKRPHSLFL